MVSGANPPSPPGQRGIIYRPASFSSVQLRTRKTNLLIVKGWCSWVLGLDFIGCLFLSSIITFKVQFMTQGTKVNYFRLDTPRARCPRCCIAHPRLRTCPSPCCLPPQSLAQIRHVEQHPKYFTVYAWLVTVPLVTAAGICLEGDACEAKLPHINGNVE